MILRVPDYYFDFACIADRCRDSCCIGWEIDIDEDTWEYYEQVPGEFGRRLRREMYLTREGEHSFRLAQLGRCPFLNACNLCDIYRNLGEEALSEVCTEYPRFAVEYGEVLQKCLSLSCEEVGRLVFTRETSVDMLEVEQPDWPENDENPECGDYPEEEDFPADDWLDEEPDSDADESLWFSHMEELQKKIMTILHNRNLPIETRMEQYLELLLQADEEGTADLDTAEVLTPYQIFCRRLEPFLEMETLDREWSRVKKDFEELYTEETYEKILQQYLESTDYRESDYEQLMVYFTFRYLMNAVFDYDAATYGKLALTFTMVLRDMNAIRFSQNDGRFSIEDCIDTARIFSKEVEHSIENVDLAKESFLFEDRSFFFSFLRK